MVEALCGIEDVKLFEVSYKIEALYKQIFFKQHKLVNVIN